MSFISYAQNGEDVLLHRVFGGQETGFYVDVGAYHPVAGSVTKAFYDRGWSGINVEPGSVFVELAAARSRDVNLRMAILDRAGKAAFVEDKIDRGASYVVGDEADGASGDQTQVPCDTLEAIVAAHGHSRPVDFVKVDAEGAEAAIVRSTDWHRLRPRVLLLEATRPWSSLLANHEWEPMLLGQGYVRAYFDGINCFYIPEEEVPVLLRHFQTPVNVLDCVEHHDDAAARAVLTAERDVLHATVVDQRRAGATLTAERDALHATVADQRRAVATLTAERDALHATVADQRRAVATLTAERDALHATVADQRRAEQERQHSEARLALPGGGKPARPLTWHRHLARRAAMAVYKLVRPVTRPMIWRLRGFMVGGLSEQLRQLGERVEAMAVSSFPPGVVQIRDDGAAAEMRRLGAQMEHTLLTLALERGPDIWSAAATLPPSLAQSLPPAPPSLPHVNLLLPHGRTAEVACAAGDLSVSAALLAFGGDWEPHMRRYLERTVQPDWVCLDIGANLGAHTLSLAVLAATGRVVAFEADAANVQLLAVNAAALEAPCATIKPVHLALWDRPGTLVWSGADELAGCTFVAEDPGDARAVERQLRLVVSHGAVDGVDLHIRRGEVTAQPLDAWVEEVGLMRLDLIKLDVEGAEARVIRGADTTLRRHRPVLLVKYNPVCAAAYFGQPADALYHELASRFHSIAALEPDGTTTKLADWPAVQGRLAIKGWEDLVCLPAP